jgi:hypothetical protein
LAATAPYVPITASATLPTLNEFTGCSAMSVKPNGSTVVLCGKSFVHSAEDAVSCNESVIGAVTPEISRRTSKSSRVSGQSWKSGNDSRDAGMSLVVRRGATCTLTVS